MVGPFGLRPRMTMGARALPLARSLVRRGHAVTLLLPPWQNPEDSGRCWVEDGVRVENVVLPATLPGWFQGCLTARMVRRVREIDPEVVHIFKPKAYAGLVHWALRRRYAVVVDSDDWEGPGGWNVQGGYPRWLQAFFTRQERWGLTRADAVTVASRALQTLVWALGYPPERVFYLPNGVEASPVPHHGGGRGERPVLLLYTRFFEYDLNRLWRILERTRDQRPALQVWVIGKGFHGEEELLLARARGAGWKVANALESGADLLYLGWIPKRELSQYFVRADLGLYPFDDTLLNRTKCPVKLLDLLGSGVPVVADAVGEIREMVVDGHSGYLVPPEDEEAWVNAILRLLADEERRAAMGAWARADVLKRLAWDRLAQIAESAYLQACAKE